MKADICDLEELPDCDVVFNLAAESHVQRSITGSFPFVQTNTLGVQRLIDLILRKPVNISDRPLLLHYSTDEVLGDSQAFLTEDAPLMPSNAYSASKASAELLIQAAARTHGLQYKMVRPSNNYGIRQANEKLIPLAINLLQRGKEIRLHDRGEPERSWLHVQDCINAALVVCEKGEVNQIYHIGGEQWKNKDIVQKIIEYYDPSFSFDKCVNLDYKRPGQDVSYRINDNKLRSLGWAPKHSIERDLKDVVEYYKTNIRW